MRVTILGRRFRLRFTRDLEPRTWGECDSPWTRGRARELRVRSNLSEFNRMWTTIHETLHGARWKETESRVDRTSKDIARILWRLGYRRASGASLDDDAT